MSAKAELVTAQNHAPKVQAEITPMAMLQMAVEQGADLDRLQKLMELQERWEANQARKAYVSAMATFKADPPEIFKNKRVRFETQKGVTEYDHATLDHIAAAIGEKMTGHGLSFRWDVQQLDGGLIRVACIVTHSMGHSESTSMQAGSDQSGGKNNIQAIGSTVTYLQRYTLLAATGLATKGMDDDGRGAGKPDTISENEAIAIHARLTDNDIPITGFLNWLRQELKCNSIEEINAKSLDIVNRRITSAIRAKANPK